METRGNRVSITRRISWSRTSTGAKLAWPPSVATTEVPAPPPITTPTPKPVPGPTRDTTLGNSVGHAGPASGRQLSAVRAGRAWPTATKSLTTSKRLQAKRRFRSAMLNLQSRLVSRTSSPVIGEATPNAAMVGWGAAPRESR